MRANPQRTPLDDQAPAGRVSLDEIEPVSVARGGVVAEWHRAIEARYASAYPLPQESRGERVLRDVSRFGGIGALLIGYSAILYLIVT